jgi:hypothetical protein
MKKKSKVDVSELSFLVPVQQIARAIMNQLSILTESYCKREALRSICICIYVCAPTPVLEQLADI